MLPNVQIPNSPVAEDYDAPFHHAFSTDHFRMYQFKVRECPRGRSHDWTECPYAHPSEKARRRDPRKYHYSGASCPDFRKGHCPRGDACDFAHGVFEFWLHPSRYRTQLCKDSTTCRRRVCFFAHAPDQLRVLVDSPTSVLSNMRAFQIGSPPGPQARPGPLCYYEQEPAMEMVESGRDIRARMYAKLSRDNSSSPIPTPDFGWVSDLLD